MNVKHRISESPDAIRIKGIRISWEYGIAFAFINQKLVWSTALTHPGIFSALRPQIGGLRPATPAAELEDEYIFSRPPLTDEDIALFSKKIWIGQQGALRERTSSGRAWKKLKHDGEVFSAISFWSRRAKTAQGCAEAVIRALKLDAGGVPVYVEYVDSLRPEIVGGVNNTRALKSKIAPRLSASRIIDILARAHTSPQSLTPLEQKIVKEFRGTPEAKAQIPGYDTVAQWNNARRIGDSVAKGGRAKKLLDSIHVDKE